MNSKQCTATVVCEYGPKTYVQTQRKDAYTKVRTYQVSTVNIPFDFGRNEKGTVQCPFCKKDIHYEFGIGPKEFTENEMLASLEDYVVKSHKLFKIFLGVMISLTVLIGLLLLTDQNSITYGLAILLTVMSAFFVPVFLLVVIYKSVRSNKYTKDNSKWFDYINRNKPKYYNKTFYFKIHKDLRHKLYTGASGNLENIYDDSSAWASDKYPESGLLR